MRKETEPGNIRIGSLYKAFNIIEYISENGETSVETVEQNFNIPKSTAHAYLDSLWKIGYLSKYGDKYAISLEFLKLGVRARDKYQVYQAAVSEVDHVVQETDERAQIMVVEENRGYQYYQKKSDAGVETDVGVGDKIHFHTTSLGKSYLAFLDEDECNALIDSIEFTPMTENTITSEDVLREELEQIRENGYATNIEERVSGMNSIGAPIMKGEKPLGAISISVPKTRIDAESTVEEYAELITSASDVISIKISHNM